MIWRQALRRLRKESQGNEAVAQLGWTHQAIGEKLGVTRQQVDNDAKNCNLAKICNDLAPGWNAEQLQAVAKQQ